MVNQELILSLPMAQFMCNRMSWSILMLWRARRELVNVQHLHDLTPKPLKENQLCEILPNKNTVTTGRASVDQSIKSGQFSRAPGKVFEMFVLYYVNNSTTLF